MENLSYRINYPYSMEKAPLGIAEWVLPQIHQACGLTSRDEIKQSIIQMYTSPIPSSQIAQYHGISKQTVLNWLRLWEIPRKRRGGANNPGPRPRQRTRFVRYKGRIVHINDLAQQCGLNRLTLWRRINMLHWTPEKAITTPIQ